MEVFRGRLDGVTISTKLAPDLPPVKADAELLRRVVVNLIDNAAEAMESSAEKQIELSTRLHAGHDSIEIAISDSGEGLSPEDKDKLFLPYFSTKERGTGLGLAIASRIIAEHNGLIRAEDNLPCRLRSICHRVARWPNPPMPSWFQRNPGPDTPMAHSILIDDDEEGIRHSLTSILSEEGYAVEAVPSGEECLNRLASAHFDVVLLDIWLPKMDGIETLERMRQHGHLPHGGHDLRAWQH